MDMQLQTLCTTAMLFYFYAFVPVTHSDDSVWCLYLLLRSTTIRQSSLYDLRYFVLYSV